MGRSSSTAERSHTSRGRILSLRALLGRVRAHRAAGHTVVFTNGCFDLIHPGHVRYLEAARRLGDVLIVAVNTDRSVRWLGKGPDRPIVSERERAEVVAALRPVDYVVLFDDPTPLELIRRLQPDVLVKGGDWRPEKVVGADVVRSRGGRVVIVPYARGHSTTALLRRARRTTPS